MRYKDMLCKLFMWIGILGTVFALGFAGFVWWGMEEMQKGVAGYYSWEKWFERK